MFARLQALQEAPLGLKTLALTADTLGWLVGDFSGSALYTIGFRCSRRSPRE